MGAVSEYKTQEIKINWASLTEKFFKERIFNLEEYLKICSIGTKDIVQKTIEINQKMLERIS